jgi:hypothetical protein
MEQFSVPDTLANFVGWLNSYGEAHQPNFKLSGKPARYLGSSKANTIHHTVTVGRGDIAGFIDFRILPVDATLLEVSAETFSQMDIIGQLTRGVENPYKDELELYCTKLIAAIRDRWRQVPQKPNKGARIREWSIYRYQMKKAGMRPPTHQEVADENSYQHNSVRNDYWRFLRENGLVDEEENM